MRLLSYSDCFETVHSAKDVKYSKYLQAAHRFEPARPVYWTFADPQRDGNPGSKPQNDCQNHLTDAMSETFLSEQLPEIVRLRMLPNPSVRTISIGTEV